ncbi:hypothetical protein K432DRAFT_383139 [Lepidopterella palustris CBS 459.81]|uniref:Arrestin C-terminal-like domain-containing protein n=1 Tax=Lepidopterella palustris CBS 459.81 TaxID=1314670 RepID=A0A8E2JEB9_9PEZI|nr:hypothetical protein K432DRAFT_383139 [Lepidopterella palustris CBS 459.81]
MNAELPQTSAPARSLFSRLKSPLQSKARNFSEFCIQPDDPHRQYSPGDVITGSVILKVIKPLRITHLVVALHGYVQVFKNPNSPGDGFRAYSNTIGSGKGKKSPSYFGNGFASLFDDESVLCGEGRLGEGVYHFNFELEFPTKGLPSSIDFERGTVSYMLTSTLTRPTTISPTTSTDTKVYLVETIDIAPIREPKPRVISLEPISRRSRARSGVKRRVATVESIQQTHEPADPSKHSRVSELTSVTEESGLPESPAPSDVSSDSQFSSVTGSERTEYGVLSAGTGDIGKLNGSMALPKGKTITATIELVKAGFLRGDNIPVKISVKHNKHVRSLYGIIITLYRQARVDMHPALPVLPNAKGDQTKSEDYYPKSRTGLGGLSLSSAGSSHVFRKDLSQSFAPLFVDPKTLRADVKASVRVPDEAFPTISSVPGAMISFKYYVEVVLDLQGKLAGLDKLLPSSGLVNVPTAYGNSPTVGRAEGANGSMLSAWGGNFIDTDSIRRDKSVVSSMFEIVIGTMDSDRKGKRRQQPQETETDTIQDPRRYIRDIPMEPDDSQFYSSPADQEYYGYDHQDEYYGQYGYGGPCPEGQYTDGGYRDGTYQDPEYRESGPLPRLHLPFPSTEPAEPAERISEKELLRRAEARLLPSQPPASSSENAAASEFLPPSAPILPDDDTLVISGPPNPSTLSHFSPALSSTICDQYPPHAQNYAPSAPGSSWISASDDKHELQRRRLEMERSAPEDAPGDEGPSSVVQSTSALVPSAPALDEDDQLLSGGDRSADYVDLPRYER